MGGKLYNVAKIVNTHGIRGEMKLISQTDFPDVRFSKGATLVLIGPSGEETMELTVEAGRPQKNVWLVKFKEINDINIAEKFKGYSIKVREEDLVELEDDEFYHHEIIDCLVVTEEGEELGKVSEILSPGANDVWVVDPLAGMKRKQILIPYIDDVVLDVNVEQKKITIRLLEGLI